MAVCKYQPDEWRDSFKVSFFFFQYLINPFLHIRPLADLVWEKHSLKFYLYFHNGLNKQKKKNRKNKL